MPQQGLSGYLWKCGTSLQLSTAYCCNAGTTCCSSTPHRKVGAGGGCNGSLGSGLRQLGRGKKQQELDGGEAKLQQAAAMSLVEDLQLCILFRQQPAAGSRIPGDWDDTRQTVHSAKEVCHNSISEGVVSRAASFPAQSHHQYVSQVMDFS